MDYEHISEDLLIELENASITPLSVDEEWYIELNKSICDI